MSLEGVDVDMDYHSENYDDSLSDIKKNLLSELLDVSPTKSSDMPPPPRPSSLNIPSDNMKVFLRIRPLKEAEKNDDEGCFTIDGSTVELSAPKNSKAFSHRGGKDLHSFKFNQIYDEFISQKVLFEDGMLSTMKEFIDGQNCLVFAYGVTNSGKTHTMLGSHKDPGIIPRALDTIFNSIGDQQNAQSDLKPQFYCQVKKLSASDMAIAAKHKMMILNTASKAIDSSDLRSSCDSLASRPSIGESLIDGFDGESGIVFSSGENLKFSIWVSFAEIYNEQIYDLLEPPSKHKRKTMTLREDKNGNPYIKDLSHVQVSSAEEAVKVLTFGQRSLQYACTKLNESSSRSHCIFNVKIVRVVDVPDPRRVQMSQLSFCDLAGSERYTRTGSEGERLKEAGNINTSLLTLGRCIQLLRENQLGKTAKVVPFRESKLTRLFQTFFSGKGRACMFVNVCPAASCFDENLQVLKFSAIARRLKVVAEKTASLVPSRAKIDVLPVLEQSTDDCRETIQWKETEDLEVTEEREEASVEQYKEWLATLKQALIDTNELLKEERRASKLLESRLRTEIAQEMMQHFTEVECSYQEQLVATRQRMEDAMEQRVHIIKSAIEDSAPDKSEIEEDLKQLQMKLECKDDELNAAKKELELMQKVTKCDPTDAQADRSEDADITKNEIVMGITRQLEEAKRSLVEKESEIADLEETLTEAKETFQRNEERIASLEKEVNSLRDELTTVRSDFQEVQEGQGKHNVETKQKIMEEKIESLEKKIVSIRHQHTLVMDEEKKKHELTVKDLELEVLAVTHGLQASDKLKEQVEKDLFASQAKLEQVRLEVEKKVLLLEGSQSETEQLKLDISNRTREYDALVGEMDELKLTLHTLSDNKGNSKELENKCNTLTSNMKKLQDQLRRRSMELQGDMSSVQTRLMAASKELTRVKADKERLYMENSSYQSQVREKQQEIVKHEVELEKLTKQMAELTSSGQEAQSTIEEIKKNNSNLAAELSESQVRCTAASEELSRLRALLQKSETQSSVLESTVYKLRKELSELTDQMSELKGSAQCAENALIEQLRQKLQSKESETHELKDELTILQISLDKVNDRCTQYAPLAIRVKDMSTKLDEHKVLYEKASQKITELTAENASLKGEMCTFKQQASSVHRLEEQVRMLTEEVEGKEKKCASLQVILDARDCQWVSERSTHESYKQQAEKKEQNLSAEICQMQEEITTLNKNFCELESNKLTMKVDYQTKVSELEAQVNSLSDELKASRKKESELETKASENSLVDELRSVLQEQERTMKVQDEVIECKENEIHQLKTEICNWNLKCQEFRDVELEKSSLSVKLASVTNNRDRLQTREEELTEEVLSLRQKFYELSAENASIQSRLQNGSVEDVETQKGEMEKLRHRMESKTAEVAELEVVLTEKDGTIAALKELTELNTAKKIEKLEEKVSRKDKIILQLENRIRTQEVTINDMLGGSARSTRSKATSSASRLCSADKIEALEADLKHERSQHAETQRTLDSYMLAKDKHESDLKTDNSRLQKEINRLNALIKPVRGDRQSDRFKEPNFTNDDELSASTLELDVTPMSSSKKLSKSALRKTTRKSTLKENASSTTRTSTLKRRLQEIVEKSTSPFASPAKKLLQVKLTPIQDKSSSLEASESVPTSSRPTRRRRKLYTLDQSMLAESPSEERSSAKKARELRESKNIHENVFRSLRSSRAKFK